MTDEANTTPQARWPLWKRVAIIAVPLAVVAAVVLVVRVLEARRGPDWRLTLNEYLDQRGSSQQVWTVRRTATARDPARFVATMGTRVPGGPLWTGVEPLFPPEAVQCVLLESGGGAEQVVYLALHNNAPHRVGWRVYEATHLPFTPELLADLQAIGCHFPPD